MRPWIDIATLEKVKGSQGRFVVRVTSGLSFVLTEGLRIQFVPPRTDVPRLAHLNYYQAIDDKHMIFGFDEVKDRKQAEALLLCHCLVKRSDIVLDELANYRSELFGFRVYENNILLGEVVDFIENPAQALLEIKREGLGVQESDSGASLYGDVSAMTSSSLHVSKFSPVQENLLLPFVSEFVLSIDEDAARIDVKLPLGLLEL